MEEKSNVLSLFKYCSKLSPLWVYLLCKSWWPVEFMDMFRAIPTVLLWAEYTLAENRYINRLFLPCDYALSRISDLCILRTETVRPHAQFLNSCYFQNRIIMVCLPNSTFMYLWAIYVFLGSVCLFGSLRANRSWEYINRSQIHECGQVTEGPRWCVSLVMRMKAWHWSPR